MQLSIEMTRNSSEDDPGSIDQLHLRVRRHAGAPQRELGESRGGGHRRRWCQYSPCDSTSFVPHSSTCADRVATRVRGGDGCVAARQPWGRARFANADVHRPRRPQPPAPVSSRLPAGGDIMVIDHEARPIASWPGRRPTSQASSGAFEGDSYNEAALLVDASNGRAPKGPAWRRIRVSQLLIRGCR